MRYRRSHAKGATYFFTVVTYKRKKIEARERRFNSMMEWEMNWFKSLRFALLYVSYLTQSGG
jgi:REP element-mobilizing transposase RayT